MAYKFMTIVTDPPQHDNTLRLISPIPSPAALPRFEKPWTSDVGKTTFRDPTCLETE